MTDSDIGRRLLRFALKEEYNICLDDVTIYRNSHGKPMIKERNDIKFNISHCEGMVVCGVGRINFGVDIENVRTFNNRVAERICSDSELDVIKKASCAERMFFKYWTLKESLGKAMGVGLDYPLKEVSFKIGSDGVKCSMDMFDFRLYEVGSSYLLAVCIEKGESLINKEK